MLNISIVLYNHTFFEIETLVNSLIHFQNLHKIYLIDNSPQSNKYFQKLPVEYIFTSKNLGYGAGHNIAILQTIKQDIPFHLVLNPDVELRSSVLAELLDFMQKDDKVGQLMPKVVYPDGQIQYLCKLLPRPMNLFFRRFLPQKWSRRMNEKFELRESGYDKIMEVPYLSGCFMFLRTQSLRDVGMFDERFFMYPEDIDLTRRIHRKYKTIYYPFVEIIHRHEQASYRNKKMLWIHFVNLVKYFNKWGWCFDRERKEINKDTLKKINLL